MFNIITRKALKEYAAKYPKAENSLFEWYHEFIKLDLASFNDLKSKYGSASIIGDDRVVFNIKGNHYRLVVRIAFEYKVVQIKWFGPHKEYDKIDVKSIQPKKQ